MSQIIHSGTFEIGFKLTWKLDECDANGFVGNYFVGGMAFGEQFEIRIGHWRPIHFDGPSFIRSNLADDSYKVF